MPTLWTFGDSLTERFNPDLEWSNSYIKWKGYVPKVYGNFVSETIGYELKNFGKAGSDNYSIFEEFCKSYKNIKDEDIVIIGWSHCERFRFVNKENKWVSFVSNFKNYLNNFDWISENTINEILINRMNYKYIQEVNNWISFINLACVDKKIIHWSTAKDKEALNTHHFCNMERISTETNNLINDAHFSEKGQSELSEELLKAIQSGDSGVKISRLI